MIISHQTSENFLHALEIWLATRVPEELRLINPFYCWNTNLAIRGRKGKVVLFYTCHCSEGARAVRLVALAGTAVGTILTLKRRLPFPCSHQGSTKALSLHFLEGAAAIYSGRSSRCVLLQTSEWLVFAVIDLYSADYINSCFLLISTPPASPMIKMYLSIQQLLSGSRTVSSCKVCSSEL